MDRRTLITAGAAGLVAALGVGRLVTGEEDLAGGTLAGGGPTPASPRAPRTSRPAPSPSPSLTRSPAGPAATSEPTPEVTATPEPTLDATATSEPSPDAAATSEPSPDAAATSEPSPASRALVVPVLCRDAWGAAPAGDGLVAHELRRMTIHHTAVVLDGNRQAPSRLRGHQRYHQDQGWPDIAYHRGVDRNGNVYELRTTDARGDTFTEYDPTGHLLLLAEGDFDRQQPTDAQLEGLAQLLAWGATRFGLPLDTISGHRDHASTSCPGDALYARLPDLRARAQELVAAGGAETAPLCGDAGRARVADIEAGRA